MSAVALTRDKPAVRPDGRCAQCGKPRHPERSRKYAGGRADRDPWCSSTCARAFYNNPVPESAGGHLGYPMGRYSNA